MLQGATIVVDIGKTNAKVSLWDLEGKLVSRRVRPNESQRAAAGYGALDVGGIDAWLIESLSEFAAVGPVARIVPVAHGAGFALLRDNRLFAEPMDYEDDLSNIERETYDAGRDPFSTTGSPALPQGLNLGAQLHRFEFMNSALPDDVVIVPWAQYWAWRLCAVAASEVSSLGCHSDLWLPGQNCYSELAVRRGWAARMAPLRRAADTLGTITSELAETTGLNPHCRVLCGLHDSNSALLAARGHGEISANDATILSTGTWFVAMRSTGEGVTVDAANLDEARDCLVNVDVAGRPIPSARFMGGREAELIGGIDAFNPKETAEPLELLARLPAMIADGACVLPSFVQGVGPYPNAAGRWTKQPEEAADQRAVTNLYLAMMANVSLDLIGSRDHLLIEGRFAEDFIFVRALASLRPKQSVYTSNAEHDVAYGALRLICPELAPATELTRVEPLEFDISDYATTWRELARQAQETS